jgi:hypothetical protein
MALARRRRNELVDQAFAYFRRAEMERMRGNEQEALVSEACAEAFRKAIVIMLPGSLAEAEATAGAIIDEARRGASYRVKHGMKP